jgi:hypothetical protein
MKKKWNINNIHLLTLLDSDADGYTKVLTDNIQLLIDKLKEETTITTYQKGECSLSREISKKIIEKMQGVWDKNNIHLLLLLDRRVDAYSKVLTHNNITVLIDRLRKGTTISTYKTGKYRLSRDISEAIIGNMKNTCNKNNIHILTLLNPSAQGYSQLLTNNNIRVLIEQLTEETTITTYQKAEYILSPEISKKIIENIGAWDKNNIHLLLLLDRRVDAYRELLTNKIDLLIEQLTEETTITTYQKAEYSLNATISEAIIEKMKHQCDKNNIHLVTLLDPKCNLIAQISSLMKVKKSLTIFYMKKKYYIQNRLNYLLFKGDFENQGDEDIKSDIADLDVSYLDVSYVGMCPLGKLILSSGIFSGSIGLGSIFIKYRKISPLVSSIILAGSAVTALVPIVINEINRHKDKKCYLPTRQKNLDKLKPVRSQKASN